MPTLPRVSIIIPSLDGRREGRLGRLLAGIEGQTRRDCEVHVVAGVSPQGRAINEGAARARGEVLVILDDDSAPADETVLERLLAALESDPRIGMAGASIVTPPDATPFQRRAAAQFPRFNTPVVDAVTDSDFACHGCCAIPKRVFEEVGREREDLIRGLDPDLRARIRAAGYRVVLAPGARIHHPLPEDLRGLLRAFFRNGYGSAHAWKFRRDAVYETSERLNGEIAPRSSLAWRLIRFPARLAVALARGQDLRFAAYCAYACGYAWGLLTAKKLPEKPG